MNASTIRLFVFVSAAAAAVVSWQTAGRTQTQRPGFDLLIRGGRVLDGSGNPWFVADVGIAGDTITAVGTNLSPGAARVIEARAAKSSGDLKKQLLDVLAGRPIVR